MLARKRHAQEQTRKHEDAARRRREQVRTQVDRTSERAFRWLVRGLLFAGLPNLVLGTWAIARARKHRVGVPLRAIVAVVVGVIHLGVFVVAAKVGTEQYRRYHARVDGLDREAERRRHDEALDALSACVLVEQQLVHEPLVGIVSSATCNGPLEERGNFALLRGVTVERLLQKEEGAVCLRRGSGGWQAGELASAPRCGQTNVGDQQADTSTKRPLPKLKPKAPANGGRSGQITIDQPKPALRPKP